MLAIAIIVPLSLIKDVAAMEKFSLVGVILAAVSILAVITYSALILLAYYPKPVLEYRTVEITYIPSIIGLMIVTFSLIGIFFNIRSSMEHPEELKDILRLNLIIGVFLAQILGFTAYFAFGSSLNSNILLDLPF